MAGQVKLWRAHRQIKLNYVISPDPSCMGFIECESIRRSITLHYIEHIIAGSSRRGRSVSIFMVKT